MKAGRNCSTSVQADHAVEARSAALLTGLRSLHPVADCHIPFDVASQRLHEVNLCEEIAKTLFSLLS